MRFTRRIISKLVQTFVLSTSSCFKSKGNVLMLHWIGDDALEPSKEPYRLSTVEFKELLTWLHSKNIIRLSNWYTSNNFYAVTIDDVPESFYYNAFPLLKEYHIPFTIFVNTSLLDTKGFISTKQLLEISSSELCTVGSHGVSHSEFFKMNKHEANNDLLKSKSILESIIHKEVEIFAFPYGSYYACGFKNRKLVSKLYRYGFGTVASSITSPSFLPNYFLPRINVDHNYITKYVNGKTC